MDNPEKLATFTKNRSWTQGPAKGPTKTRGWNQAPAKDKQLLPLIRHPPCFSYSQYVLDTTMHNQTQITQIRQEPSYKQLKAKTNRPSFLLGIRSGHHNTEFRTYRHMIGQHISYDSVVLYFNTHKRAWCNWCYVYIQYTCTYITGKYKFYLCEF
jgi:hypothetical protein